MFSCKHIFRKMPTSVFIKWHFQEIVKCNYQITCSECCTKCFWPISRKKCTIWQKPNNVFIRKSLKNSIPPTGMGILYPKNDIKNDRCLKFPNKRIKTIIIQHKYVEIRCLQVISLKIAIWNTHHADNYVQTIALT